MLPCVRSDDRNNENRSRRAGKPRSWFQALAAPRLYDGRHPCSALNQIEMSEGANGARSRARRSAARPTLGTSKVDDAPPDDDELRRMQRKPSRTRSGRGGGRGGGSPNRWKEPNTGKLKSKSMTKSMPIRAMADKQPGWMRGIGQDDVPGHDDPARSTLSCRRKARP